MRLRSGLHAAPRGAQPLLARIAAPVALLAALATWQWMRIGDYPTGIDPGNWFAFGGALFGEAGKSTAGVYPPLIPAAMHLARVAVDPMLAAKVIGIGSLLAVALAVYIVARPGAGRPFALAAALLVATSEPVLETVAFGGYPQNYALAALLIAVQAALRYLDRGERRLAMVAAVALLTVALSHHIYFLLASAVLGVAWTLWLTRRPPPLVALRRSAVLALLVAIGGGVAFLPTLIALRASGYDPLVNTNAIGLELAARQVFGATLWLWAGLSTIALVHLLRQHARSDVTSRLAAALILVSLVGFFLTHEPRLAPLFIAGVTIAAATALREAWGRQRGTRWRMLTLAAPLAALAIAMPAIDAQGSALRDFYRVADPSLQGAAAWLDRHHDGERVAVREGRWGWPVGWWFEGLTDADIAVGANAKWLAFPDERHNALLARALFDAALSAGEAATLAAESGVGLLLFQKQEWIGWRAWLDGAPSSLAVVYENDAYMILQVRSGS